jgi:hypothetical protein
MPSRRRLAVVAFGVAAATLAWPVSAHATTVEVGSWWVAQTGAAALPPPPNVADGEAYVASNASGPTAETAVRFTVPAGATLPPLVLKLVRAQPDGNGPVVACPSTSAWKPATAGTWADRPTYDCSRGAVNGLPGDGTLTFDLSGLGTNTVDVVLVAPVVSNAAPAPGNVAPGVPDAAPATYPTYEVVSAPVTVADASAPDGGDAVGQDPSSADQPSGASAMAPSATNGPSAAPPGGASSGPPTVAETASASTGSIAGDPATTAAPIGPSEATLAAPRASLARAARPAGRTARQRVLIGVAMLAVAALTWLSRDQGGGLPHLEVGDVPASADLRRDDPADVAADVPPLR